MLLTLTDLLACPRCGSGFGLVAQSNRMESRCILDGVLGCPNCRERFEVTGGFVEMRAHPTTVPAFQAPDESDALRLAAMLGVTAGPATVAIVGPFAALADRLVQMIENLGVMALEAALQSQPEVSGVSRFATNARIPTHDHRLRAVALTGSEGQGWLLEGIRALAPAGRLVVQLPTAQTRTVLLEGGYSLLLDTPEWLVCTLVPAR